jgi:hypothetical protein
MGLSEPILGHDGGSQGPKYSSSSPPHTQKSKKLNLPHHFYVVSSARTS